MKTLIKALTALLIGIGMTLPLNAAEFTKAVVKKIDTKSGKVTLIHEELKSLKMPAMTMVFRIGEGVVADKLTEGATIEFVADRVNGKLTVTEVK